MALRIVGEPEHLVDLREPNRIGQHRFLPSDPAAVRSGQATDGRLRAELWRLGPTPHPWRWNWAVLFAEPADGTVSALQGRMSGRSWSTQTALSDFTLEHLFDDLTGYNEVFGNQLSDDAWRAAHGIHAAIQSQDHWWGANPPKTRKIRQLLTWASVGVESWTDATSWTGLLGSGDILPEVQAWCREGFTPEQATEWKPVTRSDTTAAGVAAVYHDAGISPERAAYWAAVRSDSAGESFRPTDGVRLERAGWTREEAAYAVRTCRAGASRDGLRTWLSKADLPISRIVGYIGAGFTIAEAVEQERRSPPTNRALATMAALRGYPLPTPHTGSIT